MAEPDKRADYDPYFDRWNSVIFYPNPSAKKGEITIHGHVGDPGTMPCYVHKTCGAYVKLGYGGMGKYPPLVCPGCKVDTSTEVQNG